MLRSTHSSTPDLYPEVGYSTVFRGVVSGCGPGSLSVTGIPTEALLGPCYTGPRVCDEYRPGRIYGPVALDDEEAHEPALVG
jgi:hypothetical protein